MKKKLTKMTLDELAKVMPIISEWEKRTMIGSSGVLGSAESPYSVSSFEMILNAGGWTSGGFVEGMGYVNAEVTITGTMPNNGLWDSYYIGPSNDATLAVRPTPVDAADYIAQQHDLEYQQLGLSGISGTLSPKSRDADDRLIQRCNELIEYYEMGVRSYGGYPITEKAYYEAKTMKGYFDVEQKVTGIYQ